MFRDKKTQFAIRKLTTGTGILLLSVGMGINLSSKEVSASEIDPAQTTKTVQTEAATESTAEQEPAVEFSAPVQETEGTSTVESTPNVEETTVTEIPAETITGNTNNENNGSVNTGIQSPATQPEAEKPGQDTTATDNTNNENKDAVNTETQKPETTTPATQPETDKAEEGEKTPAKNETDSSSEKEESKADSDKKDEVEKPEDDPDKKDSETEVDAAEPEKDNIKDIINSILSDPDKLAEIERNPGSFSLIGEIKNWMEKNKPTWNQITNKGDFPGWQEFFDKDPAKFEPIKDHFNPLIPVWESTTTNKITITQIVNNGIPQEIEVGYDVVITIMVDYDHIMSDGHFNFKIVDIKTSGITYQPDSKKEFDTESVDPAPDGFENKITGTFIGATSGKHPNVDLNIHINGNSIKTILTEDDIKKLLQRGENVTFKYNVEQIAVKKPTWTDVIDGDNINKADWNDIFQNVDFIQGTDGNWTGKVTFNKDIIQNINGLDQGSSQTINLTKDITIIVERVDNTNTFKIKDVIDSKWASTGSLGSTNISKPGYNYEVSTEITSTNKENVSTNKENGNLSTTIDFEKLENNNDKVTITYTVTYTPIKPQPDTVNPPAKDDNIWSDGVTDKEKDDIIDKIEDGDLTWTDNGDGTWSATVDFNKQLSQSISGNMINGLPNITVDVTKKVTLIAELKGDKFHITSVTSGKWTSDSNLGQKLPESDNKYDISATVNGNDHAELKAEVENTNTIPGLDSDLIQSIINNHEYGSLLQLSYVINANPGSADPDKPAEPDTPNVDPDMGVDPENPSNPDDNNGSGDSNNSGNNPGSSDSTENTTPKPEEGPEAKPVTTPTEFTPPLSEDIEDDDKKANPDSDSAQSESNKDNKGKTVTGSKATGKKATIISLSESTTASQNSSANSQNSLATTDNEIALPQTGENKDNLSMMGIIMAGLAGALTTLGTAIKKKKKN